MIAVATLIAIFIAGLVIGSLYFGGLWLTVQHVVVSRFPARVLLVSWLARMALFLAGMYWLTGMDLAGIVAYLAGFLVARVILVARLGPLDQLRGGDKHAVQS